MSLATERILLPISTQCDTGSIIHAPIRVETNGVLVGPDIPIYSSKTHWNTGEEHCCSYLAEPVALNCFAGSFSVVLALN